MLMREIVRSVKRGELRRLVYVLIAAVSILGVLPRVSFAGMVPASEVDQSLRADNLAKVRAALERKEVAAKLADYGLTSEEVSVRLDQLTDEQAAELAAQVDKINAGGDAVGLVLGILLIVLVVLLILWLLGKTPDDLATQRPDSPPMPTEAESLSH